MENCTVRAARHGAYRRARGSRLPATAPALPEDVPDLWCRHTQRLRRQSYGLWESWAQRHREASVYCLRILFPRQLVAITGIDKGDGERKLN